MDVWINGEKIETEHSFVDNGTEISFPVGDTTGILKANVSDKKKGVVHQLYVNGQLVDEEINEY